MSLAYSKCSIKFKPNDRRRAERDYSDRSLIEICGNRDIGYSLRGTDIENGRKEIFDIQFIEKDLYKFGSSVICADEIRCEEGTYYLWLNLQSRDGFHKELRKVLADIPVMNNNSPGIDSDTSEPTRSPPKKTTNSADQDNILINIHKLDEYIANGNTKEAVDLVSKLASKHVQLKTTILDSKLNNDKLRIRVKINSIEFPTDELQILNVYRLTTISELRAVFEHTHGFPSSIQYFFINGNLADENASMNDLNIYPDSIFVLFLIQSQEERQKF